MAAYVPPHPAMPAAAPPSPQQPPQQQQQQQQQQPQRQQQQQQRLNPTAEFFLSNYRLGKTLGIGSFGKVRAACGGLPRVTHVVAHCCAPPLNGLRAARRPSSRIPLCPQAATTAPNSTNNRKQVKVAEHILTGHKVAIKILNRRKIRAMDMEEKGALRMRAWQRFGPGARG